MTNHSDLVHRTLQEGFRIWEVAIDAVLLEAVTRGELPLKAKTMEMASFILNSYEGALLRAKAERSDAPSRLFVQMIFGVFSLRDESCEVGLSSVIDQRRLRIGQRVS